MVLAELTPHAGAVVVVVCVRVGRTSKLGCGSALPGIWALRRGAWVDLQDYVRHRSRTCPPGGAVHGREAPRVDAAL